MLITPSASGSVISGSVCWAVFWNIVNHVESIPIVGRFVKKDKIYNWVNKNKVLTLSTTEVINISVHGVTSPLGPMMAAGGTIVNALVVFVLIPFRQRKIAKREREMIAV
jgi:hypothetical protein